MMFESLSDDLLLNVLSWLDDIDDYTTTNTATTNALESTMRTLPLVCRSWNQRLLSSDNEFWIGLLVRSNVNTSASTGNHIKISTRRKIARTRNRHTRTTTIRNNSKTQFFKRRKEIRCSNRQEADTLILQCIERLKKIDCVAYIRKQTMSISLSSSSSSPSSFQQRQRTKIIMHHRVAELEHRTIFHYACWYGRTKTISFLLSLQHALNNTNNNNRNSSSVPSASSSMVEGLDDSNASPLLIAAWAGQTPVVKRLLKESLSWTKNYKSNSNDNDNSNQCRMSIFDVKGVPPLTSSCGGKGPKTALVWAKRKGFHRIVRLLEEATRTCTTGAL